MRLTQADVKTSADSRHAVLVRSKPSRSYQIVLPGPMPYAIASAAFLSASTVPWAAAAA